MELAAAIERLERVVGTRADGAALPAELTAALRASNELQSFIAAADADLARRLATASSFPEAAIAETSRESLGQAGKVLDRGRTLDAAPALAAALDNGRVTPGHIDALTRSGKSLEPEQRERLIARVDSLVEVASVATVEQFGRRIRAEASRIVANDGIDRLERQRRATSLSTWVDTDGMWNVRGMFDPVTGLQVASAIENAVDTLFAEQTPSTCPSDPVLKQRHLRALAFARLATGTVAGGRRRRSEFVAVIDVHAPPGTPAAAVSGVAEPTGAVGLNHAIDAVGAVGRTVGETFGDRIGRSGDGSPRGSPVGTSDVGSCSTGGLMVEFPIPIEVPAGVLAEMIDGAESTTVVVRNGVVLHAPGELDLGRTTRLANRAQRRALRGLYRACAVPECSVSYNRCKLHHIVWWRHGGRTDLANLLPVCSHHHHKIHDDGWIVDIDAHRRLTITFPDGTVRNTGPPRRLAA